jgi:REP element-mobilizing transposase RayT
LPLIEEANAYRSVYRWFGHLKKDGCKVIGYVIMPNHFHVMLYPTDTGTSINKMVGECKRFMAYDIVQALKKSGRARYWKDLPQEFNRERSSKENYIRYSGFHSMRESV